MKLSQAYYTTLVTVICIPGIVMLTVIGTILGLLFLSYYTITYVYYYRKRKRNEKQRMWDRLKQ